MPIHICINFVGQPKYLHELMNTYTNNIYNSNYVYHILYTTWITEDVSAFQKIFPFAYIKQIEQPITPTHLYYDEYKYICDNYKYDNTNSQYGKQIYNYFLGQFVRDQSRHTIKEYEEKYGFQFDIIITTRPDIKIDRANISSYFETILMNEQCSLYVGDDLKCDVYGQGSYPDALIMGKRNHMLHLLDYISILKHCCMAGNIFHPETASYKITQYKHIALIELPFFAFIYY